jgi:hypothetical protein
MNREHNFAWSRDQLSKIVLRWKIGKHVLSHFKTCAFRYQISQNMCFEIIFCTGSERRTPALKFVKILMVSWVRLWLVYNLSCLTLSTASRLAPFSISARTDSACPISLAYISSVLPACRPAHEKCEYIIPCACVCQYAAISVPKHTYTHTQMTEPRQAFTSCHCPAAMPAPISTPTTSP